MKQVSDSILRIGGFLSDALLLAQLFSLIGLLTWLLGIKADWAGFAIIGGGVSGIISIFAFVLFGALSFIWNADAFWRTFHPLNLALAMLGGSIYGVLFRDKIAIVMIAAGVGLAAGIVFCKKVPRHPRLWIACCLVLMSLRYLIHWRFSIAAAGSTFVFLLWATYNFGEDSPKVTVDSSVN